MSTSSIIKIAFTLGIVFAGGHVMAEKVVLYSSNNIGAVETALSVVKDRSPDLDVQLVTGPTGTLMKRIEAESKNPAGDVLWTGGFGTLGAYKSYFQSYESAEANKVPERFHGPDKLWIGTHVNTIIIMVNKSRLKGLDKPKTWSDFMDPKWKGKFALTDPTKSSVAYATVYGLFKKFGEEGLRKIAANAVLTSSQGTTYKGVSAGEYAAGITLEYAAQEYVKGGQQEIELVYPTEGSILSPEGMAIIKNTKNMQAAKALYENLFSKQTQEKLLIDRLFRPIRGDIDVTKLSGLPDLKSIVTIEFDQTEASEKYDEMIALWKSVIKNN